MEKIITKTGTKHEKYDVLFRQQALNLFSNNSKRLMLYGSDNVVSCLVD